MKFLIAFATVVAVAVAVPVHRELVLPGLAGPAPVVDENGSPIAIGPAIIDFSPISVGPAIVDVESPISVGPAIIDFSPISVGPAIIEANPIAVGPAMIDFPLPDGGVVTAEEPTPIVPSPVIQPSPVIIGEIPTGSTPLVQIIVNVNKQESAPEFIVPDHVFDPIIIEEPVIPGPVNVVDNVDAPIVPAPVEIGAPTLPEVVIPEPIIVQTPIIPEPVLVQTPIIPEPVLVQTPLFPVPVGALPGMIN